MIHKYDSCFKGYPQDEIYRLFIDYVRQDEGEECFDQEEPGYKSAMTKAFEYVRNTIGARNDAHYLIKLHERTLEDVKTERYIRFGEGPYDIRVECIPLSKELAEEGNSYGFDLEGISSAALKEMEEERLISFTNEREGYLAYYAKDPSFKQGGCIYSLRESNTTCTQKVDAFFHEYHALVDLAKTDDDKLKAIALLLRKIEIFHPFKDGNQRTLAFALLNKLLIENDMSPCIPKDPYFLDGYRSADEIVRDIKEGHSLFQSLKKN